MGGATIWQYLTVVGISAVPVIELKGAIPLGVLTFGIPLEQALVLALIGGFLPTPFIVLLFRKILHILVNSKYKIFQRYGDWLKRRTEKRSVHVRKYSLLALFLLVAIPLPTTGVWTGSMVAGILDLKLSHALPVIFIGNVVCGLVMVFVTNMIPV